MVSTEETENKAFRKTKQVSFRIDESEANAFMGLVKGQGRDAQEVLRSFVRSLIGRGAEPEVIPQAVDSEVRALISQVQAARNELAETREMLNEIRAVPDKLRRLYEEGMRAQQEFFAHFEHLSEEQREKLIKLAQIAKENEYKFNTILRHADDFRSEPRTSTAARARKKAG